MVLWESGCYYSDRPFVEVEFAAYMTVSAVECEQVGKDGKDYEDCYLEIADIAGHFHSCAGLISFQVDIL